MAENNIVNESGGIEGFPKTPIIPISDNRTTPGRKLSFDEVYDSLTEGIRPSAAKTAIPLSSIYTGSRYPSSMPGVDSEEEYARQQGVSSKLLNATLKTAGTFTSSFLSGSAGLIEGSVKFLSGGGLVSFVDNESNRIADDFNKYLDDAIPNYYKKSEIDAEWWEPENIFSANFWGDKVLKNLGFSAGALAGGVAWSKMLKAIGATNKLVNIGKGLDAATEIEAAMTNVPKAQKFAAFNNALTELTKKYVTPTVSTMLKNSDRIITSATGALGEGAIEAYQSSNKFRQEAIDQYIKLYGQDPTGSDLEDINEYANKIAKYTLGANFLLLSATNYIQLPKILGASRKAEKAMINDISQNKLGGVYSIAEQLPLEKRIARTASVLGLGFSPSEAFEEFSQYAIEKGTEDFFNKGYRNKKEASGFFSDLYNVTGSIFGEGVDRALTDKEGLESILIGGISGGIQQARGEVLNRGFLGEGGTRKVNTDLAIKSINESNIQKALTDQAKFITIGNAAQRERQEYIISGDILNEKDSEHDYVMSYVMPRVKYGKEASIDEELNLYEGQALTEEGFQELVDAGIANKNEKREQFLDRISDLRAIAKTTAKTYETLNDRYADILVDDDDLGKQKRKYSDVVIDKMVYAASKINHYNSRIPELNASLVEAGVSTNLILEDIIENGKTNKEATKEAIDKINKDSKTKNPEAAVGLKENLLDIIDMAVRRKGFIDEYNKIKNSPSKYDEAEPELTINLNTPIPANISQLEEVEGKKRRKSVSKELEIGKEYGLTSPLYKEDNKLALGPKVKVLSTTLGGEYKVELPNGKIEFLTPEQFKKYELTEEEVVTPELEKIFNDAISDVLGKSSDMNVEVPEGMSPIDYVNSLDNKKLVDAIEERFNQLSTDYLENQRKLAAEMKKVAGNKKQVSTLLSTEDTFEPVFEYNAASSDKDARKPELVIPSATIASKKIPGYENSNLFGSKLPTLPNKDRIRGILVTKANQEVAGVKGLIEHLAKGNKDVDTDSTIAMVMVQLDPGSKSYKFVDVDGNIVSPDNLDKLVFQVMPLENLKWSEEFGEESMFRSTTPTTVQNAIRKEYAAFRKEILSTDKIIPYEINASFGIPQFNEDGKLTPVTEASLVTDEQLRTRKVLTVPTSKTTESLGYVTYKNASGKVFLKTDSVLSPLQNQLHTKKKAKLIYKAIHRLSELMQEKKLAEEGMPIVNWLRTVVYWGLPNNQQGESKPAGRNSVFFQSVQNEINGIQFSGLELVVSNKGDKFKFTPNSIKENEDRIVELLQTMYHNVLAAEVNSGDITKSYDEIIDITPEGDLKTKSWKNYQSYLLSSEGRSNDEIPLATPMQPVYGSDSTNRQGIYFVINNNEDRYKKATAPVKEAEERPLTPGSITKTSAEQPKAPTTNTVSNKIGVVGELVIGNNTPNIFMTPSGPITFRVSKFFYDKGDFNSIIFTELDPSGAKDLYYPDTASFLANHYRKVLETQEITKEEVEESLKQQVFDSLNIKYQEGTAETTKSNDELIDELENDDEISKLRTVPEELLEGYEIEDWNKIEDFVKKNFPKIPIGRVMTMLKTNKGRRAFGMYKAGMVYIYKNAEVGTVYHEIFHAVMDMFTTPQEKQAILNEVRSRKPEYKNLTDRELEEIAAEDARNYFQYGKIPSKPASGRPWLVNFLSDLVKIIKEFFFGKQANTKLEEVFKKMGSGYYKDFTYGNVNKPGVTDIEELASIDDSEMFRMAIAPQEEHDIVQHMLFDTVVSLIDSDKGLANIGTVDKAELLIKLRDNIRKRILSPIVEINKKIKNATPEDAKNLKEKYASVIQELKDKSENLSEEEQWNRISKSFNDRLASLGISYDEESIYIGNDPYRTGKGDYQDSRKIDNFKNSSLAIKLLLSTLPLHKANQEELVLSKGVRGVTLLPASEAYMAIMNTVHASRNINEMMESIRQLALSDANYLRVYSRLTNGADPKLNYVDYSRLKKQHNVQLINSFWRSFKKQNPDVKNLYILENGDVVVGESNFTTAARQARDVFENRIKGVVKDPKNPYFKFVGYDINTRKRVDAWLGNIADPETVTKYKENIPSMVKFLKTLDISFNTDEIENLSRVDQDKFTSAVSGLIDTIASSAKEGKKIVTINDKVLNIGGRLNELAEIDVKINNPEFSSTYFNVSGERVQTFIGVNLPSNLFDTLSKLENKSELAGTEFEYLLNDDFSYGSVMMDKMFDPISGNRIQGSEDLLKPAYADGIVDKTSGKQKEASNITQRDRLVLELNMNLKGYYSNLVPGDAAMEWMTLMGNHFTLTNLTTSGFDKIHEIFKDYFISELLVSRDVNRPFEKAPDRKITDLRFFKTILKNNNASGDAQNELHDDIVASEGTPEEVYEEFADRIKAASEKYLTQRAVTLRQNLIDYGIIAVNNETETISDINLTNTKDVTSQFMINQLIVTEANYMINNIELHKLLYSDPYQYSDELKRIKNFLSPRQALSHGSPEFLQALSDVYNKGITSTKDIAYVPFTRDHFRSIAYSDVNSSLSRLLGYAEGWKETDGSGMISFPAYRRLRILADNWNEREERQFQYDMAFEKKQKGIALSDKEKDMYELGNPEVRSAYTTIKPIVAGNKNRTGKRNDALLDKFALMPLSYRILHEIASDENDMVIEKSNAIRLYEKMQKENIDYIVFKSARKVGAGELNDVYDENGILVADDYKNILEVPTSIISIQSEVPSKSEEKVTEGSQMTKLITLDFMEAGVPVDFVDSNKSKEFTNARLKEWFGLTESQKMKKSPLYKKIKNNQELLEESIKAGYENLLKKMGMTETKKGIEITDFSKVATTIREEILKREVNVNVSKALDSFLSSNVVLEATPAYQQIRNILYSIADRNVISRKISGGQKIQIPSTFLEKSRVVNSDGKYHSDVLKFYTNTKGERICEVMIGRWFPNPTNLSDKELIEKLNKDILSGVAFRIPSQKQNSIDRFVIKGFLPTEFGDNVVVPSALVNKSGSDFDIDKLSMYLKNVFFNGDTIEAIPFYGYGEAAKNKFKQLYKDLVAKKIEKLEDISKGKRNLLNTVISVAEQSPDSKYARKWNSIFYELFDDYIVDGKLNYSGIKEEITSTVDNLGKKIEELSNEELQDILADKAKDKWYIKSLQNAYISSCEDLVSDEANFDQLVKPNSAEDMKKLSRDILELRGLSEFNYTNPGNMLNRMFMSRLRNAFVTGKYAIGIAAVNQTGHSLNQRQPIIIDPAAFGNLSKQDRAWMSNDPTIRFRNFNKIEINGKEYATLSMIKNAANEFISDILSMFIDGYVDIAKGPWIMELGATPNVASTWMFLVKVGVPIDTIAYFMNQPIIRDYLKALENSGTTWLFNDDVLKQISKKYPVDNSSLRKIKSIPPNEYLKKTISRKSFKASEKPETTLQMFMLREFLKYAKMAEQTFKVTQATNYDTATFNDPFLIFRKEEQYQSALNTIISSIDRNGEIIPAVSMLMKNSFIGELSKNITRVRKAYANVLKADQKGVSDVLQDILRPYVGLGERDFLKVAQKVVSDLFDWSVQINTGLGNDLRRLLLSNATSTAGVFNGLLTQIDNDLNHPLRNNQLIKILEPIFSDTNTDRKPNNLKLINKDNKVYDQNQIIYGFEQLKDYLKSQGRESLYKDLVRAAIVQSGTSSSPISFTSLIPYDDFVELYNDTLSNLTGSANFNINDFKELGVFQRNNWSNDDIVPHRKPIWRVDPQTQESYPDNGMMFGDYPLLKSAQDSGNISTLYRLNTLAKGADKDFVVMVWEDFKMSLSEKTERRKQGDYSFIKKALFKKVYITPTDALQIKGPGKANNAQYVYKMVNAWGDTYRANEFYDMPKESLIDNGFEKVTVETPDSDIIDTLFNMDDSMEIISKEELLEDYSQQTGETMGQVTEIKVTSGSGMLKLKDGKSYNISEINSTLLDSLGYTPKEAGKLLKLIC